MRTLGVALFMTTVVFSNAFAASQSVSPLPTGKPAGVKAAAALGPNALLILMSTGLIVGGVALTVSNSSGNNGVTSNSTSSTGTAGLP
jgi:hypothetical protein